MLILNENMLQPKQQLKPVEKYTLEQYLYESAEAYFELYQEAVNLDMKVLQSKANGVVEESALEAIEEANFEEMKFKAKGFVEKIFENIGKLVEWLRAKMSELKVDWVKNKDKFVAKALNKKITVHKNWKTPEKQLKTVCDMFDILEKNTREFIEKVEKSDINKETISEEIKNKFETEVTTAEMLGVVLGDKVLIDVTKEDAETALVNIGIILTDKIDLSAKTKTLKKQILNAIDKLDGADADYQVKNAILFQVLSAFKTCANRIVSLYAKAQKTLLDDNKAFVSNLSKSIKKEEQIDKVKEKITTLKPQQQ